MDVGTCPVYKGGIRPVCTYGVLLVLVMEGLVVLVVMDKVLLYWLKRRSYSENHLVVLQSLNILDTVPPLMMLAPPPHPMPLLQNPWEGPTLCLSFRTHGRGPPYASPSEPMGEAHPMPLLRNPWERPTLCLSFRTHGRGPPYASPFEHMATLSPLLWEGPGSL